MISIKSYGSGSSGNCYLITNKNTKILLEVGIDSNKIKRMLLENNLSYTDINACITSHLHNDHSGYLKDFDTYDVPCYCTYETKMRFLISDDNFIPLEDGKFYRVGSIQFLAFRVDHGKAECYGFIIADKDNMKLFITDFSTMRKNLSKFPVDEIFIECNYIKSKLEEVRVDESEWLKIKHDRQLNTHCELGILKKILTSGVINLSKCKKINLIHISNELGDRQLMSEEIAATTNINCVSLETNGKEFINA